MKRSKSARVRLLKLALLVVGIVTVGGVYKAWNNRHIEVVHSSFVLNEVHPLVRERYLVLRDELYANRNSKQGVVDALYKHGVFSEASQEGLSRGIIMFDPKVPIVNGEQLAMPDHGAVGIEVTNWRSENWQVRLFLFLPFALSQSTTRDPIAMTKAIILSRIPF